MRSLAVICRKEEIAAALPPLRGRAAVVIDVLRATSTAVTALAHGAAEIRLTATPEEARQAAAVLAPGSYLLGGERGGLKLDGFDLGNSPREYINGRIRGKTIVFTTTNGTAALQASAAAGAQAVWLGCLLNIQALTSRLAKEKADITFVCAGTEGTVGIDDMYCAGALIEALNSRSDFELDDSARIALAVFRQYRADPLSVLRMSLGGRNLTRLGLEADLVDCAGLTACSIVPRFDPAVNTVRA